MYKTSLTEIYKWRHESKHNFWHCTTLEHNDQYYHEEIIADDGKEIDSIEYETENTEMSQSKQKKGFSFSQMAKSIQKNNSND